MYTIFPKVYEWVSPLSKVIRNINLLFRNLEASDGLLMITPASYEPEAVAAARAWFAEKGRPAYAIGPLLPSASKATAQANEKKQSAEASEIQEFLDATLKTSGEKSLVYVGPPRLRCRFLRFTAI